MHDLLEGVADLYFSGNYLGLVKRIGELSRLPTPFQAWQLVLIAAARVERAGGRDFATALAGRIGAQVAADRSLSALLRLARGQVALDTALGADPGAEHRCRCHYYWGARLQTEEDPRAAIDAFEDCLRIPALVYERDLAARELRGQLWKFPAAPAASVFHGVPLLLWQSLQGILGRHDPEARRAADEAARVLAGLPEEPAVERAMALSDLAALRLRLGDAERAAALLEQAIGAMDPHESRYPGAQLGLVDKALAASRAAPTAAVLGHHERGLRLQPAVDDHPGAIARRLEAFARDAARLGRADEAASAMRQAIALRDASRQPDD